MELFRVTLNQDSSKEEAIMCSGCLAQFEQFLEMAEPQALIIGGFSITPLPFPMFSPETL